MNIYYSSKRIFLLLFFILTLPGLAQQKMFTGIVNDETGKPVAGALITIREQPGVKIFSDKEGMFNFSGEIGQLLEVSTTDQRFKSLRIQTNQIVLTITSDDELIPMGYGIEQRREEVTSAFGIVRADELTKNTVQNPANSLYGTIPGLTVLENGGTSWKNDPDIFVRGVGTFGIGGFLNTNILMLVDGFERPISSLSLAEIESVAILKDASALAMYGMRGANGVLLVTTKRGKGQGLSINVNYDRGITKAFRLPKFLNAFDYANAANQARLNDGLSPLYSQIELNRFQSGSDPYLYPNVNWIKESLRDFGSTDKFNITFQQQANAVRYLLVLNYDNEQGLLGPVKDIGTKSTQISGHRFNFRTNFDIDFTKATMLSVKIAGNLGESFRPSTSNGESDIFSAIYNTPSAAYPVITYSPSNRVKKNWGGNSTYGATNPLAQISDVGYATLGTRKLMTDVMLKQKLDNLLDGLTFEGGISFDRSFDYLDRRTNQFQYEQLSPILDPSTGAILDTVSTLFGNYTTTSFNTSVSDQWRRSTFLADLKYIKDWNDNVLTSVILFQREELVKINRFNTFRHLLTAANVHYGKAGKYYADFSLAYNGTNLLPPSNRFGIFPAISVGWIISNEEWLITSSMINNLKLRASWGMTGNDQVIQNIDKSPWGGSTGYYFSSGNASASGSAEGRLASSPLTFETSYKSNVGIDASLLKILDLNIDFFYDKRKGILVETGGSISGVLGIQTPYGALGITTNKGMDFGLNLHQSTGDFNYHIGVQGSLVRNKIISMNEAYQPEEYLKKTGQRIGQAFGLEAIGFYFNDEDILASPKQTFSIVGPGDIKYKDQNKDGLIDNYDQVPIGYATKVPEIYYSGSIGFEFKGIGVDALIQGIANQTVYLNTPGIFIPLRSNANISTFSANAWTPETYATATLPRLSMSDNANNYQPNSIWYIDGSYLKLRSVELYYSFPKQLLSRIKASSAKLYLRGINLLSIDNIKVVDPEETGITYPTVSSYNVGIQIAF